MADPIVHITNGVPDGGTGNITTLGQLLAILPTALGSGGGLKVDGSGVLLPVSLASTTITGTVTATLASTTITGTVAVTQSGAWSVGVTGTVAVNGAGGTFPVTGTVAVTESGVWSVRNQDGAGNALTSVTRGAQQALSIQVVDAVGNQITNFGGVAPSVTPVVSSALEIGHVLKASAGSLFSFQANTTTVGGWIMVFNSPAVPTDGPVTPIKWWQVGPSTTLGVGCNPALACASGISIAFSTTGPFTKTGSATAVFSGEVA